MLKLQQGGGLEQPGHEHRRVGPPLQVDGQLQAVQVGLVPHVGDLFDLARLHQLSHLIQNGLHGGGVGNLVDLDEIVLLDVAPPGPQLDRAPAGAVHLGQRRAVVQQLPSRGEVRGLQNAHQIHVRVLQIGDSGGAHLAQIKPAQVGRHAHGDALVGAYQHVGEGGGQEGGLGELAVVVGYEIHRVLINIPEQLLADGVQPHLGVPGGGPGHIPGVHLAEIALGIHQGVEQGAVAPAQAVS